MSGPEQLSLGAALDAQPDPPPLRRPELSAVEAGADGSAPHPPTPEQAAAIEARERDVFLEAGAGTGKTRVLVTRYCDAVDLDGVPPERILAFTFTERAAAEMRRRVRAELTRRARLADDPERRARLSAAAGAGEAVPIGTIHGFCSRLLASHPVAAGLDPRFRVLDADEAGRLAGEAYESALSELAARDDDVARTAAGYRWRLAGIIRAAHSDLRNRGAHRPLLPPMQIAALEREAGDEAEEAAAIDAAGATYDALRRLLAAYADRYAELCAARSGVDFDDLQLLALQLLRERRAIAEAQRARFDHLLVDELQDTSPIQIALVRALLGPGTRLFAVGDEFQSIYAFRGADLASFRRERELMRARAAEDPAAAAVLPLSGSFRSHPDVVAAVNAIGAAMLDGFRPLRVGRLPEGPPPGRQGEPAVEILLTRRDGWKEEGNRIATARNDAPPSRVAEARLLAERLRELADGGADPAGMVVLLRAFTHVDVYAEALELAGLAPHVVGGRGYWSAQQVNDALNLLSCVANALDDEPLLGALACPACGASPDALWMLRRIAGKRRHLWPALAGLFRPPAEDGDPAAGEKPADRDGAGEEAAAWAERIPAEDRERLARFRERLVHLRAQAPLLPLDTLVERTLTAFDLDLATLLMQDGRRRTANLRKLVRIAGEYEAHDGRDLRGFLDHAAARAALSDREAAAAAAAEDHAGVRLMTVHAAKGLEFETVAVADLGRSLCTGGQPAELRLSFDAESEAAAAGEGPPPARVGLRLARAGAASIDTAAYRGLTEKAADAEAEEAGRLTYVAASRAERRLLLSGVYGERDLEEGERPRRSRSALGCLLPALGVSGEDGQIVSLPAPQPRAGLAASFTPASVAVRVIGAGRESAARLSRDRRRRAPLAAASRGGRPPLTGFGERGAAAARSLSYAALADYERCGYRFLVERVVGLGRHGEAAVPDAPQDEGRAGAAAVREWDERSFVGDGGDGQSTPAGAREARIAFGRAVHALLEGSARNGWRPPPAETVAAALRREGGRPADAARAEAMLAGWLNSPLLAELRDDPAARFRPEVPFRMELAGDTVVRGTIDLLVRGAAGDEATIVDYKTDALAGADAPELVGAYALQRSLYAAAVAEATGSRRIRSAYVFLESPATPLVEVMDEERIAAGRERVAELAGMIRASDFAPTPRPHAALCHDCPARRRLCSHPQELTLRPAA